MICLVLGCKADRLPGEVVCLEHTDLPEGVRGLVLWLNRIGFRTVDSGDGQNHENGMECAVPFPMVGIILDDPEAILPSTRQVMEALERRGVDFSDEGVNVEGSYSPADNTTVVLLTGVTSEMAGLDRNGVGR